MLGFSSFYLVLYPATLLNYPYNSLSVDSCELFSYIIKSSAIIDGFAFFSIFITFNFFLLPNFVGLYK